MNKCLRVLWFLFAVFSASICGDHTASSAAEKTDICAQGPGPAATTNGGSRSAMAVNMFGRPEVGWAFYEPLIANEIGTNCGGATPGFAKVLTAWQSAHHIPSTGLVDPATLGTLKQLWQQRRPFVVASQHGCPDPPAEQTLARATPAESYRGKTIELRADALAAYRRMIEEARKAGLLPAGSNLAAIFSAYRSPDYDAARCAAQQNCQGITRARCSAHRTGYAMDINLGAAPGSSPDSSDDANRLFISQTPFYRWLVKKGPRWGLVNYPFEPWHWEYTGSPPP